MPVTRAFGAYVDAGRLAEAASAAVVAGLLHFGHGDLSVATGWTDRARRLLLDLSECPAHARLAWVEAQVMKSLKAYDQAFERGACRAAGPTPLTQVGG